jgi:hypothetical protein
VQEVTVYLRYQSEPVKFLAQEFDVKLDLRSRGVQELSYEAPGGSTVRVYLDPREIVAMVPRPVAGKQPQPAKAGTELAKERRQEIERAREEGFERGRREGRLEAFVEESERREQRRREKRALQTPELDRQIVKVLLNFREAGMDQLRGRYPIFRYFEKLDRITPEVVEFFVSETGARVRLDAMVEEGLIHHFDACATGMKMTKRYAATEKGARFVGAKPPRGPRPYVAQNHDYYSRMLGLCQGIMDDLPSEATWITQRELEDDKIRASLEERLGRRLPSVTPAPKGYLATPEVVVVSKKHDIVAAIGLELTQISDRRLEIYKTMLENFVRDPCLDRVYLFFTDRYSRHQVGELARGYHKGNFFMLRDYREDTTPSLSLT